MSINAYKWSSLERLVAQFGQLLILILLSRYVTPEDMGLAALSLVFISVSQVFIDSGFTSALIRKVQPTEDDYCTVFYFNIIVGAFFYLLIYLFSYNLAFFYENLKLEIVFQVAGLNILINALLVVPKARYTISLDFKTQTRTTFLSVVSSGVIAIYVAVTGGGVWAVIIQSIVFNLMNCILQWFFLNWLPKKKFNYNSFLSMYSFSVNIFIAGLIDCLYQNLFIMCIGRNLSISDVGIYNQAKKLSDVPALTMSSILQRVSFPILSRNKTNGCSRDAFLSNLRMSSFIITPILVCIAAISESLIKIILGVQWLECSIIVTYLCFAGVFYPSHVLNINMLLVSGMSKQILLLDVVKKSIGTLILFLTLNYGVEGVALGIFIHSFLSVIINACYTNKIIRIAIISQLSIVIRYLFIACVAFGVTVYLSTVYMPIEVQFLISVLLGFILYFIICFFFSKNELKLLYGKFI
ncbi:lipopolysaccharide biosynthesis protein [Aeromonas veronii]